METQQLPLKEKLLTTRNIVVLAIGGFMLLICLVLLIVPSSDAREDEWMRVMALTDEQVANSEVIVSCQETIQQMTARNKEITLEKETIKNSLWDFQMEQK